MESLKVEALHDEPLLTRAQMRQAVFEYIEVDYNRTRRHSALGYLSPENFELKNSASQSFHYYWIRSILWIAP